MEVAVPAVSNGSTLLLNSLRSPLTSIVCVSFCVPVHAPAGLKRKAGDIALKVCRPVFSQLPRPGLRNAVLVAVVVSIIVSARSKVLIAGKVRGAAPV